jgi:hypothetical protein
MSSVEPASAPFVVVDTTGGVESFKSTSVVTISVVMSSLSTLAPSNVNVTGDEFIGPPATVMSPAV